jgi:Ras-related protein Rab-1A
MSTNRAKRDYDYLLKFVIIGDSGVGKSCVLLRFGNDCFTESFISTIGVDFIFRNINVVHPISNKENIVKLQVWDTAGQDRFRSITSAYYRGADGLLIVYDITDRQSFINVKEWITEAKKYADENMHIILLGNKNDREDRKVTYDEGLKMAKELKIEYFAEISAKTSDNINTVFDDLAKKSIENKTGLNEPKHVIDIVPVVITKKYWCF